MLDAIIRYGDAAGEKVICLSETGDQRQVEYSNEARSWVPFDQLLFMDRYLLRQPFGEYWLLSHGQVFLRDVIDSIGFCESFHDGFRFESIGELEYWITCHPEVLAFATLRIIHVYDH